jgi:hypothetical protein
MAIESMVTTIDNPYDPFTEFREWYLFDETHGYHTSALVGRLTFSSDELSDKDQRQAVEIAVNEIVSENISGMFIKVTREVDS